MAEEALTPAVARQELEQLLKQHDCCVRRGMAGNLAAAIMDVCEDTTELQERLTRAEQQRDAWKSVAEPYNDANLPDHQRRRMEDLARDWERMKLAQGRVESLCDWAMQAQIHLDPAEVMVKVEAVRAALAGGADG